MAWAFLTGRTRVASSNAATSPWAAGALGGTVATDDRVIVCISYNAASGTPTVSALSDGLSNSYRKEASASYTGGVPQEISLWSAPVTSAGTPSFSVTFSGGSGGFGIGLGAVAYSGLQNTSDGTEVDLSLIATTATASGTTSGTTGAANELEIGFYGDWGAGASVTAGSGYTVRANNTPDSNAQIVVEEKDSGAAGSTASSSVSGGDGPHAATGVIVFKLASGATPLPPGLGPNELFETLEVANMLAVL